MNVFDLFVSLKADTSDYDKSISEAQSNGTSVLSKLGSGVSTAVKVGFTAAAAAVGTATTAVAALAKESVSAYADYEQLVGGIETLFGAQGMSLEEYAESAGKTIAEVEKEYYQLMTAQDTVMENASNAWQTAGMSANDYMETVSSFAASLKQSVDSEVEAAAAADIAVQDMADNANKMGTSMESIQNAYNGFSKQNYTMLDNLKLGYGGTKAEMERLLEDAQELSGVEYDISNLADVYSAIHVIQEEMGITGTTSKEAMHTISGAAAATSAAWQNVITAISGGGDLSEAMDGLITGLFGDGTDGSGLLANVIPRIQTAMEGIGEFIGEASPYISEYLPQLVEAVVPAAVESGISLVGAVVDALPDILSTLWTALEDAFIDGFAALGIDITPLTDLLDEALGTVGELLEEIDLTGVTDSINNIIQLVSGFFESDFFDTVLEIIQTIAGAVGELISTIDFSLVIEALSSIGTAIAAVWDVLEPILTPLLEIIAELAGLLINTLLAAIIELCDAIAEDMAVFKEDLDNFIAVFLEAWEQIKESFDLFIQFLDETFSPLIEAFVDSVQTLWTNLKDFFSKIWETIKEIFNGFMENVVEPMKLNFSKAKEKIVEIFTNLKEKFSEIWSGIKEIFNGFVTNVLEPIKRKFSNAKEKIVEIFENLQEKIGDIWDGISTTIKGSVNSIISFINGMISGVVSGVNAVIKALNSLQIDVPDWVTDLTGVSTFGFDIAELTAPQIPLLANGGVVTQAGAAVVGEAGAELVQLPSGASVTPLNDNNSDLLGAMEQVDDNQSELITMMKDLLDMLESGINVGINKRQLKKAVSAV